MIPYGRQTIDEDDRAAVADVLRGDWLTQGPAVADFENAVAEQVQARHAVAFANGTAALHAAMVAAQVGPGDLAVTSALTFVASANCARYVGARVGLVDIEANTLNLDLAAVSPEATVVVPVHFAGLPAAVEQLGRRPRVVIEDAAHALGALTPRGPVGSCADSDMCMFSFHPVKAITTGEGGIITTNDDALADDLRRVRNHGIVRDPAGAGWEYDVASLGFNFRLSDLHAALGLSQLNKLETFIRRRNELADRYRGRLAGLPLTLPPAAPPGSRHAYHLFVIQVADRRRVYDALRLRGIGVQVHYVPVHHHSLYRHTGSAEDFPETERAYGGFLSLPLFPALTEVEQDRVIVALEEVL